MAADDKVISPKKENNNKSSPSKSNSEFFVRCNSFSEKDEVSINSDNISYKKHNSYKKRLIFDYDQEMSYRKDNQDKDLPVERVLNEQALGSDSQEQVEEVPTEKKKKKNKKGRKKHLDESNVADVENVNGDANQEDQPKPKKKKKKKKRKEENEENEIKVEVENVVDYDVKKRKRKKENNEPDSHIYDQVSKLVNDVMMDETKTKSSKKRKREFGVKDGERKEELLNTDENSEESELDMAVVQEQNRELLDKLNLKIGNESTNRLSYEEASGLVQAPSQMDHSTPRLKPSKERKFKQTTLDDSFRSEDTISKDPTPKSSKKPKLKSVSFSIQFTPKDPKNYDESTYYRAGVELEKSILNDVNSFVTTTSSLVTTKNSRVTTPKKRSFSKRVEDNLMEDGYFDDDLQDDVDISFDEQAITDEQLLKLKSFHVSIPWTVHPLHLIEKRIVGKPDDKQRKAITSSPFTIKQGPYSKKEDETIKSNWKMFASLHDLQPEDIALFTTLNHRNRVKLNQEDRLNFARFLAHHLNDRLISSVYQRFKRLYIHKKMKLGRFSPDEDKTILEYVKKDDRATPFKDLSKILKRPPIAIEKRLMTLTGGRKMSVPISWDNAKVKKLVQSMLKATKLTAKDDLRDRKLTSVEWRTVSNDLDIPWYQLQRCWDCSLYTKLFIHEDTNSNIIRENLIKILLLRGESDWKTVNWDSIAEQFNGVSAKKLYKLLKTCVYYHVPQALRPDLNDSLKFLQDKFLPNYKFQGAVVSKLKI